MEGALARGVLLLILLTSAFAVAVYAVDRFILGRYSIGAEPERHFRIRKVELPALYQQLNNSLQYLRRDSFT